jgi:hypothetical protein
VWKLTFPLICHLERSERSRIISYIENKISPLRVEMTITTHSGECERSRIFSLPVEMTQVVTGTHVDKVNLPESFL